MSATQQVRSSASRAANSKPLEYLARGGFIAYGVIHLLFAWLILQVAFANSSADTDQSGALQTIARQPGGKFAVVLIIIGMVALAIWQAFEAAIGESGPRDKSAMAERVVSGLPRGALRLPRLPGLQGGQRRQGVARGQSAVDHHEHDGQHRRSLAGRPDRPGGRGRRYRPGHLRADQEVREAPQHLPDEPDGAPDHPPARDGGLHRQGRRVRHRGWSDRRRRRDLRRGEGSRPGRRPQGCWPGRATVRGCWA